MLLHACKILAGYFLMSTRLKMLQGHLSQFLWPMFIVLCSCCMRGGVYLEEEMWLELRIVCGELYY